LPPETRAALRRTTAVVIEDARKQVGNDLVDSVLAAKKSETAAGKRPKVPLAHRLATPKRANAFRRKMCR
jgi:hypothetical protein